MGSHYASVPLGTDVAVKERVKGFSGFCLAALIIGIADTVMIAAYYVLWFTGIFAQIHFDGEMCMYIGAFLLATDILTFVFATIGLEKHKSVIGGASAVFAAGNFIAAFIATTVL